MNQPKPSEAQAVPDTKTLNIHQRLLKVMGDAAYIQKEYKEKARHFAVNHDDVTELVRKACLKHGVYVHVTTIEREDSKVIRKYRSGEVENDYIKILVALQFVNVDNPEDNIVNQFWGDGESADNKAPGIAYSYAVKTALLKSLLIITGEDEEQSHFPDRDAVVEAPHAATPEELKQYEGALSALCTENGWKFEACKAWALAIYGPPQNEWTVDQLRAAYHKVDKTYGEQVAEEGGDNG